MTEVETAEALIENVILSGGIRLTVSRLDERGERRGNPFTMRYSGTCRSFLDRFKIDDLSEGIGRKFTLPKGN